jgi:hypothetical protein
MLNNNRDNYIVLLRADGLCSEIVFMKIAIVASPIVIITAKGRVV